MVLSTTITMHRHKSARPIERPGQWHPLHLQLLRIVLLAEPGHRSGCCRGIHYTQGERQTERGGASDTVAALSVLCKDPDVSSQYEGSTWTCANRPCLSQWCMAWHGMLRQQPDFRWPDAMKVDEQSACPDAGAFRTARGVAGSRLVCACARGLGQQGQLVRNLLSPCGLLRSTQASARQVIAVRQHNCIQLHTAPPACARRCGPRLCQPPLWPPPGPSWPAIAPARLHCSRSARAPCSTPAVVVSLSQPEQRCLMRRRLMRHITALGAAQASVAVSSIVHNAWCPDVMCVARHLGEASVCQRSAVAVELPARQERGQLSLQQRAACYQGQAHLLRIAPLHPTSSVSMHSRLHHAPQNGPH